MRGMVGIVDWCSKPRGSRASSGPDPAGRGTPTVTIPRVQSSLSTDRFFSLIDEMDPAIALLDEGTRVIARWDGGEDRRILVLFSMSQGFERLLKLTMTLILCCEGAQPSSKDFKKKYGHRLLPLLDDILAKARDDADLMQRPALRGDIDFYASDEHRRKILDILGEFGEGDRYYNLDVVLDSHSPADDPMRRWEALETAIHTEDPMWDRLMESDPALWSERLYPPLATKQIAALQRAARFLVRLWTLGPARADGQRFSGRLRRFPFLTDDQLASLPN